MEVDRLARKDQNIKKKNQKLSQSLYQLMCEIKFKTLIKIC